MSKSKVKVKVRKKDINKALKLFKRLVRESEHIQELKDRREYMKPTTRRRLKKQNAIRLNQKLLKDLRSEDKHH
jgi:ribosomal protein S21